MPRRSILTHARKPRVPLPGVHQPSGPPFLQDRQQRLFLPPPAALPIFLPFFPSFFPPSHLPTRPPPQHTPKQTAHNKMGSLNPPNPDPQQPQPQLPLRIAILGAGIAGLSLAAALSTKSLHLAVKVYESVPAHRDVGAGLALHRNALEAMSLLGEDLRKAYLSKAISIAAEEGEEMATRVILGWGEYKGEVVAELGRARGRKSVSRADLLGGFLGVVEDRERGRGVVEFGRRVGVVRVWFGDGTYTEADCVLGADGIHSVVRGYLLGEDHPAREPKNHDGWQVYRTLVSTEEAKKVVDEKWTRMVPIMLGPRGHVNCIPLNKGTRLSAGVAVRGAALGEGARKELDTRLYEDYSEDARRIVELVARDTSASWAVADHDHAPFYCRGRVAMLGDAAHAALPFVGNGAAQALEDAAVLDALFARVKRKKDVGYALRAYDQVRRPRSQAVVDMARKFGRVYAFAEGDLHEHPEKMWAFFREAAAVTNEFDVKGQNEAAVEPSFVSRTLQYSHLPLPREPS
ncbi:hypothetical protein QBC47DRAFT_426998 [Echria macrotheca]|uniref:FAD-binding domain-containing protein n=1 Tax=Echria macrotheca TaxID=438768 RepID=A0AAJ0BMT8_9PEZI|nr:hypothetical protein QBC47DRAFT_426998 [Echria macrotheca]